MVIHELPVRLHRAEIPASGKLLALSKLLRLLRQVCGTEVPIGVLQNFRRPPTRNVSSCRTTLRP